MYLTSSGLDLDLGQATKVRKLAKEPSTNVVKSCPDKLFLDTKVGVSQPKVTRLRRDYLGVSRLGQGVNLDDFLDQIFSRFFSIRIKNHVQNCLFSNVFGPKP